MFNGPVHFLHPLYFMTVVPIRCISLNWCLLHHLLKQKIKLSPSCLPLLLVGYKVTKKTSSTAKESTLTRQKAVSWKGELFQRYYRSTEMWWALHSVWSLVISLDVKITNNPFNPTSWYSSFDCQCTCWKSLSRHRPCSFCLLFFFYLLKWTVGRCTQILP